MDKPHDGGAERSPDVLTPGDSVCSNAGPSPIDEEQLISRKYGYSKEDFVGRLSASERAARRVQAFLSANDVRAEVAELKVRRTLAEIRTFTESDADILLLDTPFAIEVKGRPGLEFRGPWDIKYPDVSVDTVSGYHAKTRKPLAYVMVSGDNEGGIVLPTFSEPAWRRQRKTDRKRHIDDDFYFAAKALFVGRRAWLVDLCKALQSAGVTSYESILLEYGFPTDFVPRLFPADRR